MTRVKYNVFSGNFDLVNDLVDVSPLTDKGDLMTHDGTSSVRFGVGGDDKALMADSTKTEGLKWSTLYIPFYRADGTVSDIPVKVT